MILLSLIVLYFIFLLGFLSPKLELNIFWFSFILFSPNEKNHSADSRKFYYPRSGLKSNHNMNNKIYNYYQAKKY